MTFPDPDRALVDLLLAVFDAQGYVHLEETGHPDVCPNDAVVPIDRDAPRDQRVAAITGWLTDVLVADLAYTGELLPTPRERMRLLPGGAP